MVGLVPVVEGVGDQVAACELGLRDDLRDRVEALCLPRRASAV